MPISEKSEALLNTYLKINSLEQKVHQLVKTLEQISQQNQQLRTELNAIRKKKKDENMDSVSREIIRTKVQTMLDILEDI